MDLYGFAITVGDLAPSNGDSAGGLGLTPDVLVRPTAEDLAAGRDPVLARAAELAGAKLNAVTAGKMFPYEWLSW